jgi:hypothetical protein
MTLVMKFSKRNSKVVGYAAMSLAVMAMLATTTMVAPIPQAKAQAQGPLPPGVSQGPPTFVGNPNDLSTGPPVPNCNAIFQGSFSGPPDDTAVGCK